MVLFIEDSCIFRDQISLNKFLGSGAFGEVFEGKAKGVNEDNVETRVAVKVINDIYTGDSGFIRIIPFFQVPKQSVCCIGFSVNNFVS